VKSPPDQAAQNGVQIGAKLYGGNSELISNLGAALIGHARGKLKDGMR
jgi:hypothetical protein